MANETVGDATLPGIRPRLVLVGSPRAQREPTSPLLRLARDYAPIFRKYEIHAIEETAAAILGTGLYEKTDVRKHRGGGDGGITQLAAMIARREVAAAILFLDPSDPWSDVVENRALTRVCIQRHVRLITTYAAALRWVTFEELTQNVVAAAGTKWKPVNWKDGNTNVDERGEFRQIPVHQRSVALISHDGKKHEMVEFLNDADHLELFAAHDRILATGTTGWLLKLLFCRDWSIYRELLTPDLEKRLCGVIATVLKKKQDNTPAYANLDAPLDQLRKAIGAKQNEDFARKLMPLPSGPDGGDVIAADEILNNKLHEVIFFQDPLEAHPHSEDIRLFERTSRLPGVFSECVSDIESAVDWMKGLRKEVKDPEHRPSEAQLLRAKYGLKEVILVDNTDNTDGDPLGEALARACAGYMNHWLASRDRDTQLRIGVAWGWGLRRVLEELHAMCDRGLIEKPAQPRNVLWSPIIGIITASVSDEEARMIAGGFADFYGGKLVPLGCAGFAPENRKMPADVQEIVASLNRSDLVLTSGSAWNAKASLAKNTGLDIKKLPPFEGVAGTISGVFLDARGEEVKGQYQIVGLDYEGLKKTAKEGSVVLMCGGSERNPVVLAALRTKIVSVLVTTRQTAEWVLSQPTLEPAGILDGGPRLTMRDSPAAVPPTAPAAAVRDREIDPEATP